MSASRLMLLVLCASVVVTGGCGVFKTELDKCREAREYQEARSGQRVQVPEGLEPLPDDSWVPVPAGETSTVPTPPEEPCLIEPPDYRIDD